MLYLNGLPQVCNEGFAFLELLSKIKNDAAKIDENVINEKKKLAAKEKILMRMEHVSCDADDLSLKISKVKDVSCMTDDQVQCALLETREWNVGIQSLKEKMEAVRIDSVGTGIDREEVEKLCERVKLVNENVTKLKDELIGQDEKLCLYTLVPQKTQIVSITLNRSMEMSMKMSLHSLQA